MAVVVGDGVTSCGAAAIAVEAAKDCAIGTLEITGGCASCSGINRTRVVVFAGRCAITVAKFSRFHHVVLANGVAFSIVEAIASRCTASVAIGTTCFLNIAADDIAGSCRSVEGIDGADIGVEA